ncbi:TetR/AcrR family transcriptional regulator [Chitinophaga agrisoli]|uniref:TetR/AcrR family transcriptional regulator n=1 Tax=Chitinophaga agrisoli TaxID=2607653 RepID=A0A5B2VMB2_9BACT|nr:TetR/AcrR family transcriptional regulator [Chitinophaga agrisoli]KAA2240763.1 TetR/AcrR family transcriptional regulator [Chitinophaga agrisoli]
MNFVPKSEETRRAIIKATASIFNKKGYVGTYVSDLLKATNLTKGGIYGNFENKEDIALAAFDYNLGCLRTIQKGLVEAAKTYKDKLLAHIHLFSSKANLPIPEGGCPMGNTALEADDTDETLRKRAGDGFLRWKKDLVKLVEEGMAAGEFRKSTDPEETALHIMALLEGAVMIGKATQNVEILERTLDIARGVVDNITKKH